MEQKLCWRCKEKLLKEYPFGHPIYRSVHCHHDEPEEKPNIKFTLNQLVKIKDKALVGQDFSFARWKDDGTIFKIIGYVNQERCILQTKGYGQKDNYGNGNLFANQEDLVLVEEKQRDKCWCEMTDGIFHYFAPDGTDIRQEAKFCPECGRKLLIKGDSK